MSLIKKTTKVELEGRGTLLLRPSDYITTGGEGSVYRAQGTVVKLYTDRARMEREGLVEKIQRLAGIKYPSIVSPSGVVKDERGKPIGFYMPYVTGEPLSRVFTNDWRNRSGFKDGDATSVVGLMHDTVHAAHDSGAIMVDANELNWILSGSKKKGFLPRVIDVDSWAIDRWQASVIMLSIRDWHTQVFAEPSDWFAWGVVTFQVYTGIHPYKGRLDGFKPSDLEDRMKANASVFTKGVHLNKAVRDFNLIPGPLLDWYQATFQKSERSVPPHPSMTGAPRTAVLTQYRRVLTSSGALVFEKLITGGRDPVIAVWPCGVVVRASGELYDLAKRRTISKWHSPQAVVVGKKNGWLVADKRDGGYTFSYINGTSLKEEPLTCSLTFRDIFVADGRLFAVTDLGITELDVLAFTKPVLATGKTWQAMVQSTAWYPGVGVQNALGAHYLVLPFGDDKCTQIRVRELDDKRIVDAKAGHRFVSLMCVDANGEYQRLDVTLNGDYAAYTMVVSRVDSPELNVAILPKGVTARIEEDGELIITVPTRGIENVVSDKSIATTMELAHFGNTVVYVEGGDLSSVRMQ